MSSLVSRLKLHSLNILHQPVLSEKIASGLKIGEYIDLIEGESYGEKDFNELTAKDLLTHDFPATIPAVPAREASYTYHPRKEAEWEKGVTKSEWLFRLLDSAIIDVEIGAMENSATLIIMAENLPLSFYKDIGSHIYDEASHALQIQELIDIYFSQFSSPRTYSNRVWNKTKHGTTLLEKLMIENVIEEGSAADRTVRLIREMESAGYPEVAEAFRKLNDDEIRHVRIGNKWARYLLDNDENRYYSLYDQFVKELNPNAKIIESIQTRLDSGFTHGFIKRYY